MEQPTIQTELQHELNFDAYIFCLWLKQQHPQFFEILEELYLKSQK